jgi:hypothetical protein
LITDNAGAQQALHVTAVKLEAIAASMSDRMTPPHGLHGRRHFTL